MSSLYEPCSWVLNSQTSIPAGILERTKEECSRSQEASLFTLHWGGLFAQNLNTLLAEYPEQSEDKQCRAIVLASELSARIGLGYFFSSSVEIQSVSQVVFEVVLRGVLTESSVEALEAALERALELMPTCQLQFSSQDSLHSALLSSWSSVVLSSEQKVHWRPKVFLSGVLSSLGEVWLMETCVQTAIPSSVHWFSALQAIEDIYTRHIKAADKRLRVDQVVLIDVHLPHFLSELPIQGLKEAIAHYAHHHSWDSLGESSGKTLTLASKIQVHFSVEQSLKYWESLFQIFPNVFAGISDVLFSNTDDFSFLERRRFHKILGALKYEKQVWKKDISKLKIGFPSQVVLYTTRGGKWNSSF